jgi:hypothetical protein
MAFRLLRLGRRGHGAGGLVAGQRRDGGGDGRGGDARCDEQRAAEPRLSGETIEVDASHSIALSQPDAVADLIQTAVDRTSNVTSAV